jgi:PAS domain S-box-containing protein
MVILAVKKTRMLEVLWQIHEIREDNHMADMRNPTSPLEELTLLRGQVARLQQQIDQLKGQEEVARQEKERLQTVLLNMPVMIDAFDEDYNIVLWNHECERVTGYSAEEVVGNPRAMEMMVPDRAYRERMLRDWQARGDNYRGFIGQTTAKDGTVKTVAWSNISGRVPISPWKTWGIGVDITEQKEREKKIEESEERFRAIFEKAGDGFLVTEIHTGRLRMANQAMCDLMGYDAGEITQLSLRDIHPEDSLPEVFDHFERLTRGESLLSQNMPVKTKDGRIFYADIRAIYMNLNGAPCALGVFRDVTQRREWEKALQESEERFHSIFANAPDGLLIADIHTGRFRLANKAICDLTGYDADEITQLTVRDIHPEGNVHEELDAFERGIQGKLRLRRNVPVKTKDGRVIYVDIHGIGLNLGGAPHLLGVFRDVTEQKRAAEAMKESERRLRDVFLNVSVGIYRTDPGGRVLMANPAFVRMLGCSSFEELARQNLEELSLNLHYPRSAFRQQLEKEGRVIGFESAWTRLDGSILHAIENARIVRDQQGHVLYYEGTVEDITERARMEAMVRESENRYRTLVESAGETIAVVDKEGVFLFMNTTAAERLGGKPQAYTGKTMWELFPGPIADRQMTSIRTVIETGRGMTVTAPAALPGTTRWYSTTISPIADGNGRIHSALIIGRDVHELRQAQKELEEYRAHMARAERLASLGTLSATVAHEMNQPLTVIRLTIQDCLAQLERSRPAEGIVDDLKDCLEAVSTAASIVDRFKSFARHSSSRKPGRTNLQNTAEKVVRLWEDAATGQKVRIALEGLDRLDAIDVDQADMEQVFFSLLENAIQAADGATNHRLVIRGLAKGASVEIHFIDDCGGIAPEHVDKLFEPFFTTKGHNKGTGLGLPIVEQALSRARGKIRVENRPGEGATFIITLPLEGPSSSASNS